MGLIKGILLGSAAGVVMATGSAFAADLPSRKAVAVAYVKICDVYGRGFYYIPGTNTCLKVGGRVRFELQWGRTQHTWTQGSNGFGPHGGGIIRNPSRGQDSLGWKARGYVNLDARTQTAWGTVQAVVSITNRARSGIYNAGGFAAGGASAGGIGSTTTSPQVYAAYIRFAGFTFGRAPALFAYGPGGFFYTTAHFGGSPVGNLQVAYTAVFGGGFSATIGIHDPNDFGRWRASYRVRTPLGGATGAPVFPNRLPNLVVALRLDQGWGSVKLSGAVVRNNAVFLGTGLVPVTRPTSSTRLTKTGWAVGGITKINLPSLAKGDAIWFYGSYCNGALDYCTSDTTNGSAARGKRMGGYVPVFTNVTYFTNAAGILSQESNKSFVAGIALRHYWTRSVRSHFAVSYLNIKPGSTSRGVDWAAAGGQPKSRNWIAQGNIIWSPTRGFDLGLEAHYSRTKNTLACPTVGLCTVWATSVPGVNGVKQNPSEWRFSFRAQKTF